MKITDLKQTTNEGFMDTLKSFVPGSAENIAGKMDKQTQTAYNIGLKDFANKLSRAVNTGISSGVIQAPSAQTTQTTQQPAATQGTTAPGAGQQPGAQTTTPPTAKTSASINDTVVVTPGYRIELHDKADNQLSYYKTENGWFNAANQRVPQNNAQSLEQAADAGGGVKYNAKEVPLPPPPAPMTKNSQKQPKQPKQPPSTNKNQIKEDGDYDYLNYLVESRILNEATISQYIGKFIMNQVKNYEQDPDYKRTAAQLAQELEKSYVKSNQLDPELLKKTWDLLWNWSHLGKTSKGSGDLSDYGQDNLDTEEAKNIQKAGKFLMQAAANPKMFDDPRMKPYKDELERIIQQMK